VAGICTLCRNDLFPSYRREGNAAGRFAAALGWALPAPAGHAHAATAQTAESAK
jgi:hypothetical protein